MTQPDSVPLKIARFTDIEDGYNTYHVRHEVADVTVVIVLPVAPDTPEEMYMSAVFTEEFRQQMFHAFAIDDLENGRDPNAFQ